MKKEQIISGYSNAAHFIATIGGHGDMTRVIRAKRDKEALGDIVSRIEKKRADVC